MAGLFNCFRLFEIKLLGAVMDKYLNEHAFFSLYKFRSVDGVYHIVGVCLSYIELYEKLIKHEWYWSKKDIHKNQLITLTSLKLKCLASLKIMLKE